MNVKSTPTKEQLIQMAVKISSCNDDDAAMGAVELIMNPVNDRMRMGDAYETTLGYNPLRIFDEEDMSSLIDDAMQEASPNLASSLDAHRAELIRKGININELRNDTHLREALAEAATLVLGPELAYEFQSFLIGDPDPESIEESDDSDDDDTTVDGEEEDDDDGLVVEEF